MRVRRWYRLFPMIWGIAILLAAIPIAYAVENEDALSTIGYCAQGVLGIILIAICINYLVKRGK